MPVLGFLLFVGIVWFLWRHGDSEKQARAGSQEEELLQLCLGNRQQAERLIALELAQAPGIARHEAVRRAVRALRRDIK